MNIWSAEIKELNKIYQVVKGKLPQLEKELGRLVTTDDENMLLVYSRRCLEVIITDLCEKELKRHRGTEPLQRIIDKLNKEEIVQHNIIVSMLGVNSMSTFGAHPKEFELKQVKPVLLNLTSVLEWYLKYIQDKETVIDESGVQQGKRKELPGLTESKSKAGKWIKMVTGILLTAAIIVVALNLFNHKEKVSSIVVLPFKNYTGQDTLEWLVDGMHALLIQDMGKIGDLIITGETTSKTFKNSEKTINQITSELHVDAALETDVMSLGDYISLQVRLMLPGKKERQFWQSDFREDKNQILNLNNEITRRIADEIRIKLTPEQERLLSKSRTVDWELYEDYLKSYNYLKDLRPDSLLKARDNLNNAIEKDPDWAPLYVALGQVWKFLVLVGYESRDTINPIRYKLLKKALELDPDLAEVHNAMGEMAMTDWNWEKSEKEFKKALEINPNNALTHLNYSLLLYYLQRPEEANIQAELGYKLDPFNPFIQSYYAHTLLDRRDFLSAQSYLEYLVSLYPDNIMNYSFLENAAYANGDSMKMFEATKKIFPNFNKEEMDKIEKIYNENGLNAANGEIIRLENLAKPKNIYDLAFRYYFINDDDKAIEVLEKAVEMHSPGIEYIGTGFDNFTRLYDNPRFIELFKKMNLPLPKTE